jgi:hypothetical protein
VAPTGPPAGASQLPPDIGRSVSLVAAADGDYLVEVAHLARYCEAPQRYKLTITIR